MNENKNSSIKSKVLFYTMAITVFTLCVCLYVGEASSRRTIIIGDTPIGTPIGESTEGILVEKKMELNGELDAINQLYIQLDEISDKRNELEKQQDELHNQAERVREQISKTWNNYYSGTDDEGIMELICSKAPQSPMCNNYKLLDDLKRIAGERNANYKLLLGIMYAESHIGSNFNRENCRQTNNWGGIKWRKYDDGSISEKFTEQYKTLDKDLNGCWLYYFETPQQMFESLANTIGIGYSKCNNDIYCISKSYVGHESGSWVNNVSKFYYYHK